MNMVDDVEPGEPPPCRACGKGCIAAAVLLPAVVLMGIRVRFLVFV